MEMRIIQQLGQNSRTKFWNLQRVNNTMKNEIYSRVVRAADCQCQSRNDFDPINLRHSEISGAADEAVLNKLHRKEKKLK